MDQDTAVSQDVGSATTETTSSPDTSTSTETSTSASPASSNPSSKSYSEEQLQGILRGRIEQQKRSYEKRLAEFEKKQKDYEALTQRLNHGFEAFGRGLGFIEDEQPKYLTEKDVQSLLEQERQQLHQREVEREQRQIYTTISSDWRRVQGEVKDWADLPGFKQAWAEQWSPDKDAIAIAKEMAAFYEKRFASRQNAAAEAMEERAKVVPVKRSPSTPSSKKDDEKIPLRKRIIAATQKARGE